MVDGNYRQIGNQFAGVLIAITLAAVGAYIILQIVNFAVGLRVSTENEGQGLDVTQHGEEGYFWEASMP